MKHIEDVLYDSQVLRDLADINLGYESMPDATPFIHGRLQDDECVAAMRIIANFLSRLGKAILKSISL